MRPRLPNALAAALCAGLAAATAARVAAVPAALAAAGLLAVALAANERRVRLLAVKCVSLVVFCLVSTAVVALAALATGLALFPSGPVTLLSGDSIGMGAATVKAVWITLLVAASLSKR